jgi:hypothetical protein
MKKKEKKEKEEKEEKEGVREKLEVMGGKAATGKETGTATEIGMKEWIVDMIVIVIAECNTEE